MATCDLSVIIVNYNTFQLTCKCIGSVYAKTKSTSLQVIVVDNNSTECDPGLFAERFPAVTLCRSGVNLGFSKGNNLGIEQATGEYILLLNSDTELKNNAIDIAMQYMRAHPQAGVVSASLQYPDGRMQSACQRFPSLTYSLIELFRIHKLFSRDKRGQLLLGAFFDHKSNAVADWVWGTFFLFPRKILKQLPAGKLDDVFFMYGEDMQWCWDINKLGYEIHYCAEAEVIHHMGASSGKKESWMKENNKIFLRRNYSFLHRKAIRFVQQLLS